MKKADNKNNKQRRTDNKVDIDPKWCEIAKLSQISWTKDNPY